MSHLMNLQHFISCRHADYGPGDDPELSENGRRQADQLGTLIKNIVGDAPRVILSSTRRRAEQTAKIIADILGLSPEDVRLTEALWNDMDHKGDITESARMVREQRESVVIAVSHRGMAESVASTIWRDVAASVHFFRALGRAEAWHIDVQGKTATFLEQK